MMYVFSEAFMVINDDDCPLDATAIVVEGTNVLFETKP
jgi:hypothetical protein